MASRAITTTDWRAAFRRSLHRAASMIGAGVLFLLLLFLALSLVSYTRTDPSSSTAASGDDLQNWMGASGAWASDRVLTLLGWPGLLLLALLYISPRKL